MRVVLSVNLISFTESWLEVQWEEVQWEEVQWLEVQRRCRGVNEMHTVAADTRSPGAAGLQHSLGTSGTRLFTHDMYLCVCGGCSGETGFSSGACAGVQRTLSTGRGSWTT
uniref:Uncharacterized protein n=1 Tax=Knipowitschia caucasica TaxID=637954 RepID=A0AAV2LDC2_KNICA